MNEKQLRWLLQTRYELKFHCVRKSQWRKQAGLQWVKEKIGTADEFIKLWTKVGKL